MDADAAALSKCHKLGLHPLDNPLGDNHHTDAPMTDADREIGDAIACFLGGIFIDKQHDPNAPLRHTYWYKEMTSVDVWRRVARALRVHGLRISDAPR